MCRLFADPARWIILAFLFPFMTAPGCNGKKPQLRLTSAERVRVDTIVQRRMEKLRPEMDSICEANFDQWVLEALDSIIRIRKEEEVRLRARIQSRE